MRISIDAAQTPAEYIGDEISKSVSYNKTVTIEDTEHRKLMRIAEAVYAHLHMNAPCSVLQDACDDYSVFCGAAVSTEEAKWRKTKRKTIAASKKASSRVKELMKKAKAVKVGVGLMPCIEDVAVAVASIETALGR